MKTTTSAGLLVKSCRRNGVKASMIRLYDLTSIALIYGKVSKTGDIVTHPRSRSKDKITRNRRVGALQ